MTYILGDTDNGLTGSTAWWTREHSTSARLNGTYVTYMVLTVAEFKKTQVQRNMLKQWRLIPDWWWEFIAITQYYFSWMNYCYNVHFTILCMSILFSHLNWWMHLSQGLQYFRVRLIIHQILQSKLQPLLFYIVLIFLQSHRVVSKKILLRPLVRFNLFSSSVLMILFSFPVQ